MSYTPTEATLERAYDLSKAREGIDAPEKLRKLANVIAGEGDEQLAAQLYREATIIENAYDEANGN